MPDNRPPMPTNFTWVSVCSAHAFYTIGCAHCNAGHWVNNDYQELETWLYEKNYKLWYRWKNKHDSPSYRRVLERIFQRLKKWL